MVLDHVAHLPGLVEVTPAPFNTHLFRDGDFDMVDSAAVPVIDEQRVGKAQRQQVEDRLFTEVVVDTVDLALFKKLADLVVDFTRGFQRGTQRFFHHHARRLGIELRFAQTFADRAKGARRHGEIVDGDTVLLIQHLTQTREAAGVIDVKITELQASAQGIPQTLINFSFMKVSSASRTTLV